MCAPARGRSVLVSCIHILPGLWLLAPNQDCWLLAPNKNRAAKFAASRARKRCHAGSAAAAQRLMAMARNESVQTLIEGRVMRGCGPRCLLLGRAIRIDCRFQARHAHLGGPGSTVNSVSANRWTFLPTKPMTSTRSLLSLSLVTQETWVN